MKELIEKLENLMIEKVTFLMFLNKKNLIMEFSEFAKENSKSFELVNAMNEIKEGLEEADER